MQDALIQRQRHESEVELELRDRLRADRFKETINARIAMNEVYARPEGGEYPTNAPVATLDAAVQTIAHLACDTNAPPFTLDSNPSHIAKWVAQTWELALSKERRLIESRVRNTKPHLPDRVQLALAGLPAGSAADAFQCLAELRTMFQS